MAEKKGVVGVTVEAQGCRLEMQRSARPLLKWSSRRYAVQGDRPSETNRVDALRQQNEPHESYLFATAKKVHLTRMMQGWRD